MPTSISSGKLMLTSILSGKYSTQCNWFLEKAYLIIKNILSQPNYIILLILGSGPVLRMTSLPMGTAAIDLIDGKGPLLLHPLGREVADAVSPSDDSESSRSRDAPPLPRWQSLTKFWAICECDRGRPLAVFRNPTELLR